MNHVNEIGKRRDRKIEFRHTEGVFQWWPTAVLKSGFSGGAWHLTSFPF